MDYEPCKPGECESGDVCLHGSPVNDTAEQAAAEVAALVSARRKGA